MKILDRATFEPPMGEQEKLHIAVAVKLPGRSRTSFVDATAYVDPGADVLFLRDSWLTDYAEPTWGCKLMLTAKGEINNPKRGPRVSLILRIEPWERSFGKQIQVMRTPGVAPEVRKRFKYHEKFTIGGGNEDVLLGANFLATFLLLYDKSTITLIDPSYDNANFELANRIRATFGEQIATTA